MDRSFAASRPAARRQGSRRTGLSLGFGFVSGLPARAPRRPPARRSPGRAGDDLGPPAGEDRGDLRDRGAAAAGRRLAVVAPLLAGRRRARTDQRRARPAGAGDRRGADGSREALLDARLQHAPGCARRWPVPGGERGPRQAGLPALAADRGHGAARGRGARRRRHADRGRGERRRCSARAARRPRCRTSPTTSPPGRGRSSRTRWCCRRSKCSARRRAGSAGSPRGRGSGRAGLTVAMRDGLLVYFGDASRPHAKWLALAAVLADSSSAGADYVDVRLPERPAAGFPPGRAPSTPKKAPPNRTRAQPNRRSPRSPRGCRRRTRSRRKPRNRRPKRAARKRGRRRAKGAKRRPRNRTGKPRKGRRANRRRGRNRRAELTYLRSSFTPCGAESSGGGRESAVLQAMLRDWPPSLTGRDSLHRVGNPVGRQAAMLPTFNFY